MTVSGAGCRRFPMLEEVRSLQAAGISGSGVMAILLVLLVSGCAPSAETDTPEQWRVVEELRIGSEEDGPEGFGWIAGLVWQRDGSIAVLDAPAREIRFFDAEGEHLRSVSRRGAGPGELGGPTGMVAGPDGMLWVNDPSNSRISVFAPSGEFLRQHVVVSGGWNGNWGGYFDAEGRLVDDGVFSTDPADSRVRLRRFDAGMARVDTVVAPSCNHAPIPQSEYVIRLPRGSMAIPYFPFWFERYDQRGSVWCAKPNEYRLTRLRIPDGDTLLVLERRGVTPAALTPEEREAAVEEVRTVMQRSGEAPFDFNRIPRTKPLLEQVSVDDANRIWVRIATTGPGTTWDVFSADGRYLAQATAPFTVTGGTHHPIVRGERMVVISEKPGEVARIVRARIGREARP